MSTFLPAALAPQGGAVGSSQFSLSSYQARASASATTLSATAEFGPGGLRSASLSSTAVSTSISVDAWRLFAAGRDGGGLALRQDDGASTREGKRAEAARTALEQLRNDPMKPVLEAIDRLSEDLDGVFRSRGLGEADAGFLARQSGTMLKIKALSGAGGVEFSALAASVSIEFSSIDIRIERSDQGLRLSVNMQSFSIHSAASVQQVSLRGGAVRALFAAPGQDPLILDMDGNGVDTKAALVGKLFDINGDGSMDRTGWVAGKDALLALDRNGNGRIDNGRELFGDQWGASDGFAELAKFDGNGDRLIDAADQVFGSLTLLYADGRMGSLEEAGVMSISLNAVAVGTSTAGGTTLLRGGFTYADGRTGRVDDVVFDARLDVTA